LTACIAAIAEATAAPTGMKASINSFATMPIQMHQKGYSLHSYLKWPRMVYHLVIDWNSLGVLPTA